jgi:phenylpropionate dioxygenase-like ring-hydroxylating dioxygenase large terminal subunit
MVNPLESFLTVAIAVLVISSYTTTTTSVDAFTPNQLHRSTAASLPTRHSLFSRNDLRGSTTTLSTATRTLSDIKTPIGSNNNKDSSILESMTGATSKEQFDWNKAWYPLVPIEILDVEKPHRFDLLGESIVVWNDGVITDGLFQSKKLRSKKNGARNVRNGTWRAFVDECPHRKVPLSEGRVEDDGTLLCSYHAWRFNGTGACVNIPQLDPSNEQEYNRIITSPKSSCNSYPTKVIDGVLFVWPSSDKDAVLESELTPIALPKSMTNKLNNDKSTNDNMWYGNWNYRELPYSADYFIENVVDPAHVMVSHHNIIGNRYAVQPMMLKSVEPLHKDGFKFFAAASKDLPGALHTFAAPGLVTIETGVSNTNNDDANSDDNQVSQTLELFVSPSRPGYCNHVGRIVIQKTKDGKVPQLLRQFTLPMPKWLNHVLASVFLNQDALFIHRQERHLASTNQYTTLIPDEQYYDKNYKNSNNYNEAAYLVPADYGVVSLRNWIRVFAGGRVPYRNYETTSTVAAITTNAATSSMSSNDVVFDVWNSHTKYCNLCQVALRRLKLIRFISYTIAGTLAIIRPMNALVTLASSLTFTGIGLLLNKLIQMFYRYEVSHANND